MKTLYMVRHAKSSWKHDVIDHKRPLKGRGKRDGVLIAAHLGKTIKPPQKIISSDAARALSTAHYLKDAFNMSDDNFTTDHNLYDFSGQNVFKIVKNLPQELDRVLIVGHNHAFTSIANMLGDKYIDNVPTCGFVHLEFEADNWKDIVRGKTISTVFPRDLK